MRVRGDTGSYVGSCPQAGSAGYTAGPLRSDSAASPDLVRRRRARFVSRTAQAPAVRTNPALYEGPRSTACRHSSVGNTRAPPYLIYVDDAGHPPRARYSYGTTAPPQPSPAHPSAMLQTATSCARETSSPIRWPIRPAHAARPGGHQISPDPQPRPIARRAASRARRHIPPPGLVAETAAAAKSTHIYPPRAPYLLRTDG